MYTFIYVYVYLHTRIYVYTCIFIYMYIHMYIYPCMCISIYISIYLSIYPSRERRISMYILRKRCGGTGKTTQSYIEASARLSVPMRSTEHFFSLVLAWKMQASDQGLVCVRAARTHVCWQTDSTHRRTSPHFLISDFINPSVDPKTKTLEGLPIYYIFFIPT